MNCLSCGKKLKEIKEDLDYNNWERKYHKKCWNEKNIYFNLYLKASKDPNYSPKILEFYKQKSCLN